jgi:hypothetical protein
MGSGDVSEGLGLRGHSGLRGDLEQTVTSKVLLRVNRPKQAPGLPTGCGEFSDTLFWAIC